MTFEHTPFHKNHTCTFHGYEQSQCEKTKFCSTCNDPHTMYRNEGFGTPRNCTRNTSNQLNRYFFSFDKRMNILHMFFKGINRFGCKATLCHGANEERFVCLMRLFMNEQLRRKKVGTITSREGATKWFNTCM